MFVGNSTRDKFIANVLVDDAVLRNLKILGQAAKNVPEDVKARLPEVAWREIVGTRNWIAHGYFTIKADVVWNAVAVEVPLLLRTLQAFKDDGQS